MKKFCYLILFALLISGFPCNAQFNISLLWSGGTGGGNTDLCGPNVVTITADTIPVGLTYKWFSRDYSWSCGVGFTNQPVLIDSGTAIVYISESGFIRCVAVDSFNQVQGTSTEIAIFNTTLNEGICGLNASGGVVDVCNGDSTYLRVSEGAWQEAINLNGNGTIQWQMNGVNIPGASNLGYYATSPGSYRVLFTLSCGAAFSNAIQVNYQPIPPTPVITGVTNFCQGQSFVLTANGIYSSYLWSTGETTQTITVNTGGPYTVSVSNTAGCIATATTVVTVNPNPLPQITGNPILCLPQTTTLNAGGGYSSYQWNIGTVTQSLTVSNIGTYTVTVTDNNGCTGSDSIQVTGPYATISGDNTICNGISTNLFVAFNGIPPFTYSYYNGTQTFGPFASANTSVLINVSPGFNTIYTLLNFSDANCNGNVFGSAAINISNPTPVISGDSTLCQLQSTVLNAGTGYAAYLWSTGAITQTISVSLFGNYTVTVTDSIGCMGTDNITIGAQPPYTTTLSASGPLGLCIGDSVQLIAQTPMVFYQWFKDNIQIPGATSSTLWASVYGKYKCQSLDPTGCAATSDPAKVSIVCFPPLPPEEKTGQLNNEINTVTLYPNPSQALFNYELPKNFSSKFYLQVTDLLRNTIRSEELTNRMGTMDLSAYPAGIYFLKVNDGISTSTVKLIKTNK